MLLLTLLWQKIKLLTGDKDLKKTQIDSILKKFLMAMGMEEMREEVKVSHFHHQKCRQS